MDFSDFRKEYARKYRTPEEAVEVVKSGDWVDYTSNVGFPYLLDRALAYIEDHLAEKITLGDIAKHCWVSQSTITQTFRNKLGLSFYRCVTQARLIAAKRLIEGDQSLESIAEAVGFMDYSAFYRAFKQEFGISPRQYRVNHNQISR